MVYTVIMLAQMVYMKLLLQMKTATHKQKINWATLGTTYYVKELDAPQGYALDETVYTVTPKNDNLDENRLATVNDGQPLAEWGQGDPMEVSIYKKDKATGKSVPQGDGSLKDTQFKITYYDDKDKTITTREQAQAATAKKTWVIKTDSNGKADFKYSEYHVTEKSDEFYKIDNQYVISVGTITIEELEAPQGYNKNDDYFEICYIEGDKTENHFVDSFEKKFADGSSIYDPVKHFGVRVEKLDKETDENSPVGGATLEGAEFSIYNVGTNAVKVNGKEYATYTEEEVKKSDTTAIPVATISTDDKGVAVTGQVKDASGNLIELLPYSTYLVKETKAPKGYVRNATLLTC